MKMAKRLIDADKIKYEKVCEGGWGGPPYYIAYKRTIDEMPTVDAVEVVRCKDCKHRGSNLCPMETVELYPWFGSKNDAFCSYGERRNDG